jgi:hypothetical protein
VTWWQRRQAAQRLRGIALQRVLAVCGARRDPRDPHKWHTAQGTLSVTGAKFRNWTCDSGGGGAIDLVMHLQHLDFKAAVAWLSEHFGTRAPDPLAAPTPRLALTLPAAHPGHLPRVRHYLSQQRALPPALWEPLLQAGTLYADARANAVFLLRGKENRPVGAELRGTTATPWRGLAPGSQKDLGCFAVPLWPCGAGGAVPTNSQLAASPIILCESAIDALSCLALHPHCRCLSTAGARPDPRWLQPLLQQPGPIYCGFDADPTGDHMAAAMITLHPTVKRLRPPAHDWNDVLKYQPR